MVRRWEDEKKAHRVVGCVVWMAVPFGCWVWGNCQFVPGMGVQVLGAASEKSPREAGLCYEDFFDFLEVFCADITAASKIIGPEASSATRERPIS